MKVVSLFAGIGGFDLGFDRAGFEIVAHVEKDKNCLKLLKDKWPNAQAFDDVCSVGKHNLPPCNVICAGFPCQDLSVAGKRAGLKGSRSGLFYEYIRILDELRPSFTVWENVPGLFSSDDGRDFARVLLSLADIGYFGACRVLDSQWFGVAQRRRRIFGVFARGDFGAERCAEILSLEKSLQRNPAPSRKKREGAAESVAPGIGVGGQGSSRARDSRGQDCVIPVISHTLRSEADASEDGTGRGTPIIPEICGTLSDGAHMGGGLTDKTLTPDESSLPSIAWALQERDAKGQDSSTKEGHLIPMRQGGFFDDAAQVQWASGGGQVENKTAQALRANAENNYQFARIGMAVRRLTPTECERLQGFPDSWTACFADSVRYRMLGNAVTVNVAEWIARRIIL